MKTIAFVIVLSAAYLASAQLDVQNFDIRNAQLHVQSSKIPNLDLDDFVAIKERCDKAGGPGTYDKLKASIESLQTCITQFANLTVVKDEIEEAKKTGSMDEVFGKYCNKRPKLASCVQDFANKLRPCLNSDESKTLNTTLGVLQQLGDFVCYRDGDRIAMFIAEGGVECIQSHAEGIKSCVNSSFNIEPARVNANSLPSFVIDKKKCDDLGKLQHCVVEELEKCEESTPANIVDALFKFIKRSACPKTKRSLEYHNVVKRSAALINSFYDTTPGLKSKFLSDCKAKCDENAPDGGYEAFTLTLESAIHCIKNKTKTEPIFVTSVTNFKDNVNRCVTKLVEKTEACLSDDEKYWPKFYLDSVEHLIDFLYENKNVLMNVSTRAKFMQCFQNFKSPSARKELAKCFEVSDETNSLKKDVVCGRIINIKSCFSEQLKKRCVRDVDINNLTNDFFNAIANPCK